jgi:hypothetical protein
MAGHIGFELRCAERIFISLNARQCFDLPASVQTVPPFQENKFLLKKASAWPRRPVGSFNTSEFASDHGGRSDTNRARIPGRMPIVASRRGLRNGCQFLEMAGRDQEEQASAHYLLDVLHERSVSGFNRGPSFRSVQVRASPPRSCGSAARRSAIADRPKPVRARR